MLLMSKLTLREVKPHRKLHDVKKPTGSTWWSFHEGSSRVSFQELSGANLKVCSLVAHPPKVSIFKPLKFQRGKPWIHCGSSSQCLCEFLTSIKVCFSSVALSSCSLRLCDVSFQRLSGLKEFDWAAGQLPGWILFVFWFEASPRYPLLILGCTPKPVLTVPLQPISLSFWDWDGDYMYLFLQLVKIVKPFFPFGFAWGVPNCNVSRWSSSPSVLSESFLGVVWSDPALIIIIMLCSVPSKSPHCYNLLFPLVFSWANTADEGDRVGRNIQMNIWLLGNLAYSRIVTSQSDVDVMAELLGISVLFRSLCLQLWRPPKLPRLPGFFLWGLLDLLSHGTVCGEKLFSNQNEKVSVKWRWRIPSWSCDL